MKRFSKEYPQCAILQQPAAKLEEIHFTIEQVKGGKIKIR
jgi:hypothetical protein